MSDTVKLIIEIPKEVKQAFDTAYSNDLRGGYYDCGGLIGKAIQNGTPLDDVKDEINEIEEEYCDLCAGYCGISKQAVMDILCVQKVRKNEEKA